MMVNVFVYLRHVLATWVEDESLPRHLLDNKNADDDDDEDVSCWRLEWWYACVPSDT